mmetsp:Transcript_7627/g.47073  ORF Transcript_7627/g.47073 Transcript_7627/m.47073 type:complete len:237 (+) Transcript_7627:1260-1970(+)
MEACTSPQRCSLWTICIAAARVSAHSIQKDLRTLPFLHVQDADGGSESMFVYEIVQLLTGLPRLQVTVHGQEHRHQRRPLSFVVQEMQDALLFHFLACVLLLFVFFHRFGDRIGNCFGAQVFVDGKHASVSTRGDDQAGRSHVQRSHHAVRRRTPRVEELRRGVPGRQHAQSFVCTRVPRRSHGGDAPGRSLEQLRRVHHGPQHRLVRLAPYHRRRMRRHRCKQQLGHGEATRRRR